MTIALLVIGGIGALATFVVLLNTAARRVAGKVTAAAFDDPATVGAVTVAPALLGGVRAAGMGRTLGNGVLALHPHRLVFVLAKPRRTLDIALERINDVEVSKVLRMPGRYVRGRRPWLIVRWRELDGDGAGDGVGIVGVIVADPQRWAQAIRPNAWRDTT